MERMKPPRLPEEPPPVLREAELRAILATCERDKSFAGRRDEAVLRIFMDTGARRGEVLSLGLADVDLEQGLLCVTGKGSRTRLVPIGALTVRAVDRYVRARAKHPGADLAVLWIGKKGRLTESGLGVLVRERGVQAGIPGRVHPHLFRHAYAHMMLAAGMQETDLMAVVGWRSRDMVARYAASTRAERAIAAARAQSRRSTGPRTVEPGAIDVLGSDRLDEALTWALELASRSMWARMSWLARLRRSTGASLQSGSTSRSTRCWKPRLAGAVIAEPPSRALVVRPPTRPHATRSSRDLTGAPR